MKPSKAPVIFTSILFIIAMVMVISSFIGLKIDWLNIGQVIAALLACVIMDVMLVDVGGVGTIDFMDSLIAFIFFAYDYRIVTLFVVLLNAALFAVNEKLGYMKRKMNALLFNTGMIIVVTFITSMIFKNIWKGIKETNIINVSLIVAGYIVVFLIINLTIFIAYRSVKEGRFYHIPLEYWKQTAINGAISILTTSMLVLANHDYNLLGSIFILLILAGTNYWISNNNKLEVKNRVMKGIIKITRDIVRYGDFREKCKYLTINLKELIPYSVCAIYSFNYDSKGGDKDTISYPVAFYKPEGMDIGELEFTVPSNYKDSFILKSGNVYVSSNPYKELNGQLSSALLSQIETAIIAPVIIDNKLAGMIFIGGNERLLRFMAFGLDDLLNILSNQMALAIENNNIYNSIRDSANIDELTKLYNRNVFKREVKDLIATRTRFSLVIYDIDDFKKVNDTYGHLAGDEVLRIISSEIRKSIRKTDVPCRYGGEEIVIIFKDLNKDDAVVISDRIRKKIENISLNWNGNEIGVTICGGIASYPDDGETAKDIIEKADKVLYAKCKLKGKNKVSAYYTDIPDLITI